MNKSKQNIKIGLVGHPSCGKDTVAEYLTKKHNFAHVSTGDIVRDYISKNMLGVPTRELMRDIGKFLRNKHGHDYLIKVACTSEIMSTHLAISGLRAYGEATAIKEMGGHIVVVTAPIEIRYRRALERGRVGDGATVEEFIEQAKKDDLKGNDPYVHNISAIIKMADYTISNHGTMVELYKEVDQFVFNIINKHKD